MLRRNRVAGHPVPRLPRTRALWPVALAVVVRLVAWALVPASRFASDEDSYFQVSTALLARGHPDVFWPPMTGWLIALARLALGTDSVAAIRLVWIAFDIGCVLAVQSLAGRVADQVWPTDSEKATRLTTLATAAYAVYLPAISYAQFLTSETPALLQTLLVLVLVTRPNAGPGSLLTAGLLAGTLVLTRPSLLPLLVLLPMATTFRFKQAGVKRALIFLMAGTAVVGAHVYRNWRLSGDVVIATNSAYNLYIGNRDMYAEDLNLFDPRATAAQIEFRRQQWSGELEYPTASPAELQRMALAWIEDHPGVFVRRAVGRLARVFVPRTDVLELLGGERAAGIFAPSSLLLLAAANVQWTAVLFGGIVGLVALLRLDRDLGLVFASTIAAALLLCLIAISKPRYSFVFDPLLLICAVTFLSAPSQVLACFGRRERAVVGGVFAFLMWGWVAFAIFSVSSRAAP